ncbi:acetyl-CoA acetyltransferase [Pseudonocardia sp. TRM90224]|uniref:acetyl-CoA acetyltransferase n=1 Tax=Pseudonocardia sp. TRM90224 TaxID=2812678 RepID=UPI001E310130|nr:acetyl-CoA acetyltransferase [Pseudonocardia sp. TRM90224]
MEDDLTPVLVGVGQVRGNRERDPAAAREPAALVLDAVAAAAADSGAGDSGVGSLLGALDSIATVHVMSWAYDDLAGRIAAHVGATPRHTHGSTVGGQWPAVLLEQAAARIAAGESRVALVAGGEAQASIGVLRKAGIDPVDAGWSAEPGGPPAFDPSLRDLPSGQAGLLFPTRVYPLFHSAHRHAVGLSPAAAAARSAQLYAAFTQVAALNPAAWNPEVRTAAEVGEPGPGNRMVCEPYPLAMNAMPHVDQAAAVLVTSLAAARELGVPDDRIVHVVGGAGAKDSRDVLARPSLARSDALADARDRCLAGVDPAELDAIDVYSCFPIVPELVAHHLGLPVAAVAGVTGGHNAFGGPLSSYTLHALVAVTQKLRAGAGLALVHGNGGFLTSQHALLLSRSPRDYRGDPEPRDTAGAAPPLVPVPDIADVTIEAATVEHGRDGAATQGFMVARTAEGGRFAAATPPGDAAAARALSLHRGGTAREIVGSVARVVRKDEHVLVEGT